MKGAPFGGVSHAPTGRRRHPRYTGPPRSGQRIRTLREDGTETAGDRKGRPYSEKRRAVIDCPEEAKRIDEFEKWPEIGSRAGAVKSCVSLLSAVCGQPDDVMERWLDLYYQVRHAQEKADAAARAAERLKEMAQLEAVLEPFQSAASITSEEDGGQMAPASAVNDEAATEPETKPEPEVLRENRVKRPGGKGEPRPSSIGNTRGHDAAVFKRQVRDRLEAVRKKGVSAPELVKAAPAGSVKESDIYMILQGLVIKIDIYRALDEALRHFEN